MSCRDTARQTVLAAASNMRQQANHFGIMRSVDATEASKWLHEIADALFEAAGPDDADTPADEAPR